ncbi:hypothetical protein BD311DRAFT_702219 [Dichomitus squalens]|uniref:Uncharacterized protein n=1 Tax=Dichomitus squalens TaxID=114155 RepID=A0A4Q9MB56_9APHY|nr:hypothetical protein BD311DRAFT_702219 [Dichomitus squalens]
MWLLNTKTGEFKSFGNPRHVRYAILSHVWSTERPEQSYQETLDIIATTPAGTTPLSRYSDKLQRFCEVAAEDNFDWGWADSSCIDKTSSSELTESLNSMYDWYRYAGTCYTFLHDLDDVDITDPMFREEFRNSKWFTRGWTLQELLASKVLLFLSKTWRAVGSKHTLAELVESVTGIDRSVLTFQEPLESFSIACKMSWAASRTTTRVEDEAYALMGIFGVNIPISYGEGRYAFIRLQEAIVRQHPDQTIFAWGRVLPPYPFVYTHPGDTSPVTNSIRVPPLLNEYFLASGPREFSESTAFRPLPRGDFAELLGLSPEHTYQLFTPTSYGMHAYVPLLTIHRDDPHLSLPTHLAILACEDGERRILALLLRPQPASTGRDFLVGAVVGDTNELVGSEIPLQSIYYRVTYLSRDDITALSRRPRSLVEMVDLYIPHRPPVTAQKSELEETTHAALRDSREFFEVRLSGWCRRLLKRDGYTVTPENDTNVAHHDCRLILLPPSASATSAIVIQNSEEHITIRVGRCNCVLADTYHLLAVMVSSRGRTSPFEIDFQSPHHKKDHSAHIHSWRFSGGFAEKEISLESKEYFKPTIHLRLTFSHDTQHSVGSRPKVYRLGVEIWSTPPLDPPLSTSPVSLETIQIPRTLSYSEVAASPPVREAALASQASRMFSLYPGRLPSQDSRMRTSTLIQGSHRQRSATPQQTTYQESLVRPQAARYSRNGNITEPVTRRVPSVVAPPVRISQSASPALSSFGFPSRASSQYSNGSQETIRPGGPRIRQSTTNGAFDGGIAPSRPSRSNSRTPGTPRQTSTRAPSPIVEYVEQYDQQNTTTSPVRQNGGIHTPVSANRQRSRLYQGSGRSAPGQQRPIRHSTSQYQDSGQGRSRGRGRDGSGQWEYQVEEDSDL